MTGTARLFLILPAVWQWHHSHDRFHSAYRSAPTTMPFVALWTTSKIWKKRRLESYKFAIQNYPNTAVSEAVQGETLLWDKIRLTAEKYDRIRTERVIEEIHGCGWRPHMFRRPGQLHQMQDDRLHSEPAHERLCVCGRRYINLWLLLLPINSSMNGNIYTMKSKRHIFHVWGRLAHTAECTNE